MPTAAPYWAAISKLNSVVEANPRNTEAYNLLGFSYRKVKNFDSAGAPITDRALRLDPLLVLRHDLRPARRAAAGKASGTEGRDLGPGAAGGDRSRPEGIALGGRGLPPGLGSASGMSRHPGCPQSGARPDAREQSALAPSLPLPWRQSP